MSRRPTQADEANLCAPTLCVGAFVISGQSTIFLGRPILTQGGMNGQG